MAGGWSRSSGWRGLFTGWAGLGRFWLIVLVALGLGAGVLQVLGPSAPPAPASRADVPANPAVSSTRPAAVVKPPPLMRIPQPDAALQQLQMPGRQTPGPTSDPDPALAEANGAPPNTFLPRISPDGRAPMHEYAAGFDPTTTRRPRIGILIAGIGLSDSESVNAIRKLPGAVSLAVSPYATNVGPLLASARIAEHEYLLSIPMEPQGYPVNDPDDRHALMTSLPRAENLTRLHWVLSRIAGYVGVTSALGPMRGERLAAMEDQFNAVLEDVAARGLLFLDARPEQPVLPIVWNRSIDLVIDEEPADEASLNARLESLTKLAKDKGSALGLVTAPRPLTVDRIVAWTNTLAGRGLILAPVSALMLAPAKQEQEK